MGGSLVLDEVIEHRDDGERVLPSFVIEESEGILVGARIAPSAPWRNRLGWEPMGHC